MSNLKPIIIICIVYCLGYYYYILDRSKIYVALVGKKIKHIYANRGLMILKYTNHEIKSYHTLQSYILKL